MEIQIGESYTFYSELQYEEATGVLPRKYTGQSVKVLSQCTDVDEEITEPLFNVEASDGVKFSAWEGELDGSIKESGRYYGPTN